MTWLMLRRTGDPARKVPDGGDNASDLSASKTETETNLEKQTKQKISSSELSQTTYHTIFKLTVPN